MWQARRDSNPQHPDLESDALPLELLACNDPFRIMDLISAAILVILFGFLVRRMLATKSAIFTKLQLIRCCAFIFGRRIISAFAFSARKGNNNSHLKNSLSIYSIISLTTPAPTVRPPSRTAKRSSFLHGYRRYQMRFDRYIVAGHHHLHTLGQRQYARHIRGAKIKLRPIATEKRRVTTAFLFAQYVYFRLKLGVRR